MNKIKADGIAEKLLVYTAGLKYGSVSVTIKLHDGQAVSVCYTTTNQTREQEIEESKKH